MKIYKIEINRLYTGHMYIKAKNNQEALKIAGKLIRHGIGRIDDEEHNTDKITYSYEEENQKLYDKNAKDNQYIYNKIKTKLK